MQTLTDLRSRIEAANTEAHRRMTTSDPVLVGVIPAGDVVPGLEDRMVLHSGPPIEWSRMCGAQRGSIIGIILFEGWARSLEEAVALVEAGEIRLEPNHHHSAVGPMAGTTSRSLPVWVVENRAFGNRAYCRFAEDRQQFGDYGPKALGNLQAWRDIFAPAIHAAVERAGGVPLRPLMARALEMGDELHNRPNAASSLFANMIAGPLVKCHLPEDQLLATLGYLAGNEFLFLGISMAAGKSIADAATGIDASTVVTAMARNGTEFGIRVSGLGDEWFVAPSPRVEGLLLPGYREEDAGLDMGDSAIAETVGWGGFVLGGAPGILGLVGGTPEEALAYSRAMARITVGPSPVYRMPALGFAGAPTGIDIRKVVATGEAPIIDTAIAHREPGHPKIGGGIVRAPMACFEQALASFGARYRQGLSR